MTMIERVARAIAQAEGCEESYGRDGEYIVAAKAAVGATRDDILAAFDAQLAIYEAKKDQAFNADMDDRWERMEHYRDACSHMRGAVEDMINKALEGE